MIFIGIKERVLKQLWSYIKVKKKCQDIDRQYKRCFIWRKETKIINVNGETVNWNQGSLLFTSKNQLVSFLSTKHKISLSVNIVNQMHVRFNIKEHLKVMTLQPLTLRLQNKWIKLSALKKIVFLKNVHFDQFL